MAEAVQLPSFDLKYFCHHCSREVSPFSQADLICPHCSSCFLEEVTKDLYETENIPPNCDEDDSEYDGDTEDLASIIPEINMDNLISQMLLSASAHRREADEAINDYLTYASFGLSDSEISDDSPLNLDRWRYTEDDEVDALASQLLDEVEVSGPPPLSKDDIKALPSFSIAKKHLESGLQCTVCMEDFSLREKAKILPCKHMYHEKCITPWLEKQATCPNCRDTIVVQHVNKRSRSSTRSIDDRRVSDAPSLSDFFTTSMNPFRFLNN